MAILLIRKTGSLRPISGPYFADQESFCYKEGKDNVMLSTLAGGEFSVLARSPDLKSVLSEEE